MKLGAFDVSFVQDINYSSFHDFIHKFNNSTNWASQHCSIVGDWKSWTQSSLCSLRAVSDGSFKDGHGTAAFFIQGHGVSIEGCVITPGTPADMNAYRSELAGLYAISVMLWSIANFFSVEHGTIEIACDGLSAIRQAQEVSHDTISPNTPHFDLILAIRQVLRKTKWNHQWRHVRGHQDKHKDTLDFWEETNVRMDRLAKTYWQDTAHQQYLGPLWGEPWRVVINDHKLTSSILPQLTDHCTAQSAVLYWNSKKRCQGKAHEIDWDAIGGAVKQLQWNRRIWITKQVTGFSATGINMFRRKERDSSRCPRCTSVEDSDHVLLCQGGQANDTWEKAVNRLTDWLLENNTHPFMVEHIGGKLRSWRYGLPTTELQTFGFQDAAEVQDNLGWNNFCIGIISTHWRVAQQRYWDRIGCKLSIRRWTSALIRKVWDIAWDMWEHRNAVLHNKTQSILIQELQNKIRQELLRGPQGLPSSAHALFSSRAESLLNRPLNIQSQWLARVRTAREVCHQDEAKGTTYHTERRIMKNWLQQK